MKTVIAYRTTETIFHPDGHMETVVGTLRVVHVTTEGNFDALAWIKSHASNACGMSPCPFKEYTWFARLNYRNEPGKTSRLERVYVVCESEN